MATKQIFQSKTARQTFWILLLGAMVIYGASIYLGITYVQNRYIRVSPRAVERLLTQAVTIIKKSNKVSIAVLHRQLHRLNRRGFRVWVSKKKDRDAVVLTSVDKKTIANIVRNNQNYIRVSIPVDNTFWLNIRGRVIEHRWLLFGFILTTIVTVAALVLLCYWAIRRLAIPIEKLTDAAKRFGVDVQAPPLAEMGSPEMQEVIQAFNEMQGRIRRLIHDRTNMLAAISHDLRSPITRLQLRAEYLKDTPQYEKAITDLNEMERMITSILSFARDHMRSEVAEVFDFDALLESLCNDFSDTGHHVEYHGAEHRVKYYGRLSAIKRALSNLIENAIKYGDTAQIYLTTKPELLQIRIDDQGPGIPQTEMAKVFEPFYRVDAARSPTKSGVGLGMAVARDIIIAHGGDITLMNREPRGLSVIVTLPVSSAIS